MPVGAPEQSSTPALDPIGQNIETISNALGRPFYLGAIVLFVVLWILANVLMSQWGGASFDRAPFPWLQGIVGLGALLLMILVLIKQNRLTKLEERRAHLELQVNLLTEQKTTKLINLAEELRRDLPMIKDRHDPEATAYQQPTDPESVLAALGERLETGGEQQISKNRSK